MIVLCRAVTLCSYVYLNHSLSISLITDHDAIAINKLTNIVIVSTYLCMVIPTSNGVLMPGVSTSSTLSSALQVVLLWLAYYYYI